MEGFLVTLLSADKSQIIAGIKIKQNEQTRKWIEHENKHKDSIPETIWISVVSFKWLYPKYFGKSLVQKKKSFFLVKLLSAASRISPVLFCQCYPLYNIISGCYTKFCDWDFVLKSVVMGEKKDFQVESGLFRDLFRRTSGLYSLFS